MVMLGKFLIKSRIEKINCSFKKGQKKILKRNNNIYKKISDHIGLIPLVMISPDDIDLINEGYLVDRISNYTSVPVRQIDKKVLNLIKENPPDVFFIYSSLSAKNLFNLINKYSLLNIVTHSYLMCISEKVLLVLKQIKWKKEFIFSPGEEEFLLDKIR